VNIRILVADDFEPWRRLVSSLIAPRKLNGALLQVSDGVEAVEKVGDLRPELILLTSAFQAQWHRSRSTNQPNCSYSKILFLSGSDSLEVVEEALILARTVTSSSWTL